MSKAYLAAIEGHNWELEGIEHGYQIIKIYSARERRTQLEPEGKPMREQAELIVCIHSESAEPTSRSQVKSCKKGGSPTIQINLITNTHNTTNNTIPLIVIFTKPWPKH